MSPAQRVALLANPDAGSGLGGSLDSELAATTTRLRRFGLDDMDDVRDWAPERIVIAGGDGSVAPCAELAAQLNVPVGVIPVGTANDFARHLDLPEDPAEAARLAVDGAVTRAFDLARIGERPFVNVASAGLAPRAADEAEPMKGTLGSLAYAVGAVKAAATADPIECMVEGDGVAIFEGEAWQLIVACSGAFGGGASVSADPQDGWLDVVVIPAGPRAGLLRRALGLRLGEIGEQQGVVTRRAETVEVDVPAATQFNVDGEIVESGPATLRVDRRTFEVVVG